MTALDVFDEIDASLRAHGCTVRRQGDRLRATCPSHSDKRPSLSVDLRGDRVLVRCHAGCQTATVLKAVGLTLADLVTGARTTPYTPRGQQAVVAGYEYVDVTTAVLGGDPTARKLRLGPAKSFRWESRDGARWRRGLQGADVGLYGLADVIDMSPVYLCEGEKAVDTLRQRGLPAVCPPTGASGWRDAWAETLWTLNVRHVVVLPDHDRPGRLFALRAARSLHGCRRLPEAVPDDPWPDVQLDADDPEAAGLRVSILTLPGLGHSEDAHDWLTTHGHSPDELRALVAALPDWQPTDPITRRRALTRLRVTRHRQRRRQGGCNACVREKATHQPNPKSFPVESTHAALQGT